MKRRGNLFEKICSFENLLLAAKKAQKGKRFKRSVREFNFNLENELVVLKDELAEQTYQPGEYRQFYIYDPKKRLISAAPYRDRVIQHALCNVIGPIFDKGFIYDSYACREGKGTLKAIGRFMGFSRKTRYVLKCDVKEYFASIDHGILLGLILRKIKDLKVICLIKRIIDSTPSPGIPIGNLTSQIFANLYLDRIDHFLKESAQCHYYLRYMDDLVIFSNNKDWLTGVKNEIRVQLGSLKLRLHENKSQIHLVGHGVPFLGYKIWPTHRVVLRQNVKRFKVKMKKYFVELGTGKITLHKIYDSIRSWFAFARHADSFTLRQKMTIILNVSFLKGVSP